ncbi:MAG: Ku protein [Candidatus Micrarchaeia archaeon]|jgi:DNA end-binding protein Ku
MKAIFSGAISFGLVLIPIKIYTATEPKEIEFHNLCNVCNTPLTYKRWCPKCQREVKWNEMKKGFRISKERWVIIEKSELEKIKLKSSKTIEIKSFVDSSQLDPLLIQKSYFIVPNEEGLKAYSLLVESLSLLNKIAIGKITLKNKEYVVAIRAYKQSLLMHTLFYLNEIKDVSKFSELKGLPKVTKEEIELAKVLIDKLSEEKLDLSKFKDEYSQRLKEIIKAKVEGKEIVEKVEKEKEVEAKSLMEALKASVESVEKKKKKEES